MIWVGQVREEQLPSTDCWPTVGNLSVDSRLTVGQLLASCQPTEDQQASNSLPADSVE